MLRTKETSRGKGVKKQKLSASKINKIAVETAAPISKQSPKVKKRSKIAGEEFKKISAEERHRLIAITAYYRAERRTFQCKCSERDWFDAAAEIDSML